MSRRTARSFSRSQSTSFKHCTEGRGGRTRKRVQAEGSIIQHLSHSIVASDRRDPTPKGGGTTPDLRYTRRPPKASGEMCKPRSGEDGRADKGGPFPGGDDTFPRAGSA